MFMYHGRNGDTNHWLWPLNFTLYYLGSTVLAPFVAFGVEGDLPHGQAVQPLKDHQRRYPKALRFLETRATIAFNGSDDWDEEGRLKPGAFGSPFVRADP